MQSAAVHASGSLSRTQHDKTWVFPRSQFPDGKISLTTDGTSPLLYEIIEKNVPQDITRSPARHTEGIEVTRTIERIDESKGISKEGTFIGRTAVDAHAPLEYGALYQVQLQVKLTNRRTKYLEPSHPRKLCTCGDTGAQSRVPY